MNKLVIRHNIDSIISHLHDDYMWLDADNDYRAVVNHTYKDLYNRGYNIMNDDGILYEHNYILGLNEEYFIYNNFKYQSLNYDNHITRVNLKTNKKVSITLETYYKNFIKFIKEVNNRYYDFELRYSLITQPNVNQLLSYINI